MDSRSIGEIVSVLLDRQDLADKDFSLLLDEDYSSATLLLSEDLSRAEAEKLMAAIELARRSRNEV
jgi:hypothetical protein